MSYIDYIEYLNLNPDLKKLFDESMFLAKNHWEKHGILEKRKFKLSDFNILFPKLENIDFINYFNTKQNYKNLKYIITNEHLARNYWIKYGSTYGDELKLKNIDYKLLEKNINNNFTKYTGNKYVNIITNLYNDKNIDRFNEYILTLKINVNNNYIKKIHIFWDLKTGEPHQQFKNIFDKYSNKINIIYNTGRTDFFTLFDYPEKNSDEIYCVCNGDIILSSDICKLHDINIQNKLIALTRWEFISEESISIKHRYGQPNKYSQDVWCFKPNLNIPIETKNIFLGVVHCDGYLINEFKKKNIPIYNPCNDIITLHLHIKDSRSYILNQNTEILEELKKYYVDYCKINDIK